jgi:NADPH:quinone reductase-like Zn-dependent oxidoreductase
MTMACAGTVVDVGTGVWNWKKGDVVWGGAELFRNGAHAEYIAINQVRRTTTNRLAVFVGNQRLTI